MSDEIPRLLDGKLSPLERSLLESAKSDAPSPEAIKLAASSLGIADALPSAKWGLFAKGGAAVALASALGLLGVARLRTEAAEPPHVVEPAPTPPSVETTAPGNSDEKADEASVVPAKAALGKAPATKPGKSSIEGEIRMIEEARRALDAGDNGSAISLVTDYRRRYPRPALAEEATVIRILALERSGSSARASREASQFLASHPKSPHASRLAPLASRTSP